MLSKLGHVYKLYKQAILISKSICFPKFLMYNHITGYFNYKGVFTMSIPNDPVILLSYINTQLRDNYPSLKELCRAADCDEKDIIKKLSAIGYEYSSEYNKFI